MRYLTTSKDDAQFMLGLLNQPSFIEFIGDRGVRNLEGARDYIQKGAVDSYSRHGFGLYLVLLKERNLPIGICGLVKRETLKDVDVGFAFLPEYWSYGYAYEAAVAVIKFGRQKCGVETVVAITSEGNLSSIKLLKKLGMKFERMIKLKEGEREVMLFSTSNSPGLNRK